MEIQLSFQCIPVEISMKYQWKSIGYQVKIVMKFKWKSIGNPVRIQLQFQWNTRGIFANPVKISIYSIYQLKFQCYDNRS